MVHGLLVLMTIFCAYRVMRARQLMAVIVWLAIVSALVATLLYLLGAHEVAVMELSVGAGLVTVLFVFAFSIVGEETFDKTTIIPRPLAWLVSILLVLLLGLMTLPLAAQAGVAELSFGQVLWEQRGLDVLVQVVFLFAGVMGLIGLLSEREEPEKPPAIAIEAPEVSLPSKTEVDWEERIAEEMEI